MSMNQNGMETYMMKATKQHLIILMTLVAMLQGAAGETMAASYTPTFTEDATVTFTQVSGTTKFKVTGDDTEYTDIGEILLNTAGITVTLKFNTGTFIMSDRVRVLKGTLIIQPNGNKKPVLKRNHNGLWFYVNNTTTDGVNYTQLHIKGTSSTYKVTIDGGAEWSISGSNENGWTAKKTSGVTAKYPMFYIRAGRGEFQYVDFQNAWNNGDSFQGGAFRIYTVATGDSPSTCRNYVLMDDCTIKKCYCKGQGGAMQVGGGLITSNSLVQLTNVTTQQCFSDAAIEGSGGGVYRTGGNSTAKLVMKNCTLKNNYSNASGTITWNSAHAPLELEGCSFQNNYTKTSGGALSLYSAATIKGCTFSGNYATDNGGAIFYYTYTNTETNLPNFAPQNGSLSIDANTTISDNEAGDNGGGLWVTIRPITCLNASGNSYTVYKNNNGTQYEVHLNINGPTISGNTAGGLGGGIYLRRTTDIYKTDLKFNYGTVEKNTAASNGGGFYVTSNVDGTVYGTCPYSRTNLNVYVGDSGGTITKKATVSGNQAQNGGGIYATGVKLSFNVYANAVIGKSGTGNANQAIASTGAGGGVFFNGQLNGSSYGSFTMNGGSIDYNTSVANGAGIYIGNGTCTIKGGSITYNKSTSGSGGGIFVNPAGTGAVTTLNSTSAALSVSNNEAVYGGGIFVEKGSLTVTKGTNALTINSNTAKTANTGSGGGVFAKGTVTISGATLSGNKAEGSKGGGIYSASDNITVQSSASVTGNKAKDGAGIYAASGNITIQSNSTITSNVASNNGGGIYSAGGTVTVKATATNTEIVKGNSAKYGGGIYAAGGTVDFSDGIISGNYASEQGGGLYIPATGKLTLKGTAKLTGNHVPAGKKGGGVYLAGVVEVGSASKAASTITAEDNYAGSSYEYGDGSNNRNNIYLPDPVAIPYTSTNPHVDVITVVENGLTTSSSVGFSVPHNFVPVIYCAYSGTSRAYLDSYLINGSMAGVVFEDSEKYSTMHSLIPPYDPDHIYLSNLTWVQHVTSQPASGFTVDGSGNVTISTKEGLAWLISYVNGLNTQEGSPNNMAGKTVTLTADVDMDEYSWVPIGFTGQTFQGTFNGNGHTVSGINCIFLGESGVTKTGLDLGMFGNVSGSGSISNLIIDNAYYSSMSVTDKAFVMGGVAAKLNSGTSSVSNSGAQAEMETISPTAIVGGLVGQVASGTIHSSFALPFMKGYQMGGLVGANGGDLYNSYAYTMFTPHSGSTKYMGGLVGVNTGRVENCYARIQNATAPDNTYFGYLVGDNDNTSGTLNYSYAPANTYTASGMTGTQTGLSTFGVTAANAYNYRVRDNQVSATNDYAPTYDEHHLADYQLKKYLNNWVEQDAAHKATYAGWTRPTTQAINGDYPLLKLHGFNAVSATSGEISLNYGDINTLLTDYATADNSILFYGIKEGMDSNSGSAAPLYIDEDAVLTPSTAGDIDEDAVLTHNIQAYVGVTIDNSACHNGANPSFAAQGYTDYIDWHFFSSALADAPIGLTYGDEIQHVLGEYPSWHATFNNANGYFPTNLNDVVDGDDYYEHWDLYGYYEPHYHWVNYKRNSASHWHEDWPDIPIPYTNHTNFQPGYGYMVALKDEGYLQAYGTLNTHPDSEHPLEVDIDYTPGISWTTREGQNLLGNPYQSYLDFNAFVGANRDLWGSGTTPFYIVMDEEQADYVIYAYTASYNAEAQASRYIHPHQGFMIKAETSGMKAKFHDGMRTTTMESGWSSDFRDGGSQPNYALVNLFVKDKSGNRDIVTVELGRPEKGGVPKSKVPATSTGRVSCHYEGESYALVFTEPGLDAANIRFVADEDGEYTMTWNTQNGEFSYLHLIDNMTGADIDCLSTSEYKFSARESDYNSRFRLVFDYTGVEENEDGPSTGSGAETFAYFANGEIHLMATPDATAQLQIIDMTGRVIVSRDGVHTVSTTGLAAGVYVLRLTDGNGTRTQKIILN